MANNTVHEYDAKILALAAFLECDPDDVSESWDAYEAEGGEYLVLDEAVRADGRGHFLSSYDGEEVEQSDFFIYRVN